MSKTPELRAHFEKVSSSLDSSLAQAAGISRAKESECAEARNELTAVGTCFAHTALDYVFQVQVVSLYCQSLSEQFPAFFQINLIQSRKRHEIIEAVGLHRQPVQYAVLSAV